MIVSEGNKHIFKEKDFLESTELLVCGLNTQQVLPPMREGSGGERKGKGWSEKRKRREGKGREGKGRGLLNPFSETLLYAPR